MTYDPTVPFLDLAPIPDNTPGIYTIDHIPNRLPKRFRWLQYGAAQALAVAQTNMDGHLILTDVLRAPLESLAAMKSKNGVAKPGLSGHNYGLSIDLSVDQILRDAGIDFLTLLSRMRGAGWVPIRDSRTRGFEDWHFNWQPTLAAKLGTGRFSSAERTIYLQGQIEGICRDRTPATLVGEQTALKYLGLYHGEADNVLGPLTLEGRAAFRRTYGLNPSSTLEVTRYQRLLALACDTQRRGAA